MADEQIIKACKNCLHYEACKGTYYSAKGDEDILHDFDGEMYANSGCEDFEDKDLINRQKEEIEEYQKHIDNDIIYVKNIKSEAKKEFAEELIYKIVNTPTKFESTYYMYREGIAFRQNEIIDIIKEMAGDGT